MSIVSPQVPDMKSSTDQILYVLITPARNEARFIEKTIESVIHQTSPPLKWVIVDDASTDKTPEIISSYLAQHPWIEMVQMPARRDRSFSAKVNAFNAGYQRVKDLQYEVIGNMDADISFDEDFLAFLIPSFRRDNEPSFGARFGERPNATLAASSEFDQLSMIALASSRTLDVAALVCGRVADDLPATRSYISKFLAESGYTLSLQPNGVSYARAYLAHQMRTRSAGAR